MGAAGNTDLEMVDGNKGAEEGARVSADRRGAIEWATMKEWKEEGGVKDPNAPQGSVLPVGEY